jgi:uncharacterized protein (DUF1778 family)
MQKAITDKEGNSMKTVTMRVDDSTWRMISAAADGQKRTISSFLEFAVLQYLSSSQYVDNVEMRAILKDKELVRSLKEGLKELKNGEYSLV